MLRSCGLVAAVWDVVLEGLHVLEEEHSEVLGELPGASDVVRNPLETCGGRPLFDLFISSLLSLRLVDVDPISVDGIKVGLDILIPNELSNDAREPSSSSSSGDQLDVVVEPRLCGQRGHVEDVLVEQVLLIICHLYLIDH